MHLVHLILISNYFAQELWWQHNVYKVTPDRDSISYYTVYSTTTIYWSPAYKLVRQRRRYTIEPRNFRLAFAGTREILLKIMSVNKIINHGCDVCLGLCVCVCGSEWCFGAIRNGFETRECLRLTSSSRRVGLVWSTQSSARRASSRHRQAI